MKWCRAILSLSFLFCGAGTAWAQSDYYLSQVANGRYSSGSFRTTFVLFNTTDTAVSVTLELTDDNGGPLRLTIQGMGTESRFNLTLDPGASRLLQTDGSGDLVAGAARVRAGASIGVSAIFTIYDTQGKFLTEAGVGASETLTEFVLPVDATGSFNTGVALFNVGTGTATVSLRLLDTSGQEVGRTTVTLASGAHLARFVGGQLFPNISNFRGTLLATSSIPIAAVGLRQNDSPLSYTSLPAVSKSSTRAQFNLPQVANGDFSGGSFRTTFLLFNMSTGSATVDITLTKGDGTPFAVTIPGRGTNSTFSLPLAAGASVFLQTDGTGPLTAGAARITSTVPLGAAAIFTVYDAQGRFQTEAGVGDSPAQTALTLPVDITGAFDTAVAFFNPGDSSINLTLTLLDQKGFTTKTAATITLAGKNQTARFVSQLFTDIKDFQGSVSISASGAVAALTLRQNSSPLSYTTLPVATGASKGTTPIAPLLTLKRTGIDAQADQTINETLSLGFLLSGKIEGSGEPTLITAKSGSMSEIGVINSTTKKYLIVVPAGTYTLTVCYTTTGAGGAVVENTYQDPTSVQVSGDTTYNLTLPAQSLVNISGTVSGLSAIQSFLPPSIEFTRADNLTAGTFQLDSGGKYQGQLPSGTYTASLTAFLFTSPTQSQTLSLYNLGSVTVSGSTLTANLTVPATAKLTGTLRVQGLSPLPFGSFVWADDNSVPSLKELSCVFPPTSNIGFVDTNGAYQLLLANQRTYRMSASVQVSTESGSFGSVLYPVTEITKNMSGDGTMDFDLPALPAKVVISGRVTDAQGKDVKDASVLAYSTQLTGAANMSYTVFATTGANGDYRLVVLSGTNYEITFTPPKPQP